MTATYTPTATEIAAKQKEMDAAMLASHPAWAQRTSPSEAERALVVEHGAAHRAERDREAVAAKMTEIRAERETPSPKTPIESKQSWAAKYETVVNADKAVSYIRDGEERFVDRGYSIGIAGNDKDSIRDAVRLAREKWGDRIHVATQDENKRDAILEECARQGVRPQAELEGRYAEIKAEVERQREAALKAEPAKQQGQQRQQEAEHEHEM